MNDKEIKKIYKDCSPVQQAIIQILGVNILGLRQADLLDTLSLLGFYDKNNKPLGLKKFRLILNELVDKKAVVKEPVGVVPGDSWKSFGFEKALDSGRFDEIAEFLRLKERLKVDYSGLYEFNRIEEYERAIQFGFSENMNISFKHVYFSGSNAFLSSSLFYEYFCNPFRGDLLDRLSVEKRFEVIEAVLFDSEFDFYSPEDLLNYSYQLILNHPKHKEVYSVLSSFFFCGGIREAENILKKINDESSDLYSAFMGVLNFLRGEDEKALSWFSSSLLLLKKRTGKRKIFITGLPGIFYILCLLRSEKNDLYKDAVEFINITKKQAPDYYDLFKILLPLFHEKTGGIIKPLNISLNISNKRQNLFSFFFILVVVWTDIKGAKKNISSLKVLRSKAEKGGFKLLEAECLALLAYLGNNSSSNRKKSLKIHKELGTKTITDIIGHTEDWEKRLKSLILMGKNRGGSIEEKSGESRERLVWILRYFESMNHASISPRLQKLSKNGKWTKGRAVSLKTLHDNFPELEYLSDQDKKICSSIKVSSYKSGYYYSKTEYYFHEKKSLKALAGHPLIFSGENPDTLVELVKAEPEIRIRREKGKLSLEMNPMPADGFDGAMVLKETSSRFKLVDFSQKHRDIAGIIGQNGLELPKKAEKMAVEAASSISSLITINSDLDIGKSKDIKSVEAHPVPNVHIMPWQEGIQAEIFVRPFGDTGSYFRPGRGGANVFAEIEGKKVQASRDLKREKELAQSLVLSCPTLENIEEVGGQWLLNDPEDALELLWEIKEYKSENQLIMKWPKGGNIKVEASASFDNLNLNIKKNRDWFNVTGSFEIDKDTLIDLSKIMELLDNSTGRFIEIDDKKFIAITASLKERLEELRSFSNPLKKGVKLNPVAALAVEEFFEEAGAKRDKAWKDHCKRLKEVKEEKIPATLQADLRDYQKEGFHWLSKFANWNMGACLADDMGLGKTLQAISVILLNAKKGPSLVIAPVSVISNWEDECKRFAPTLNPIVFGTGDREKFLDGLGPFDLVLSSYGLLQIEGEKLKNVHFETIVLDEAQAIKNMKAKRTKAAMELKANFRIITTGTPVENHLDELWTLFHFINPGLLGSFKRFRDIFAIPIEKDNDKKASKRLKKLIRPFILRRMKTDVLKELPEKTEITLSVEMAPHERKIYEAQRLNAIKRINESEGGNEGEKHLKILAELTRLRQICCNPSLVMPDFSGESSKLTLFKEIVEELIESSHKVLVFSQFTGHLKIIRSFLDKEKISYQYLDGSTPAKKRKERINAFQGGEGDLFLISLKAGGFGLNLTAADYVIHMDPWWNPAVEDQASDRAHRIGQTRPVTVYRLVVKDSIEEKIINLHKEKRDLAQTLLEGSDAAGKFSADDLLGLLQGR